MCAQSNKFLNAMHLCELLKIFAILGFENIRDYRKICEIIYGFIYIAETHHSAAFHIT